MKTVTASVTSTIGKNAPPDIIYIPVGSNEINATISGKPGKIRVNVPLEKGTAIAAALQDALNTRLAGPVRPRLGYDHDRMGPASGHPAGFSFDPARGIILSVNWSNSGRAAIEGGDYGYFSPTFFIDDDGTPAGLPPRGEIGSLVDEPAFRNIGAIAAGDTSDDESRFYRDLVVNAGYDAASEDEAKQFLREYGSDGRKTSAQRLAEREKIDAAESQAASDELENRARQLVAGGQAATLEDGWIQAAHADSELYAAASRGGVRPDTKQALESWRENSTPGPREQLEAIAAAILKAGEAATENDALLLACERNPKLYQDMMDVGEEGLKYELPTKETGSAIVAGSDFEARARGLVAAGHARNFDDALGQVACVDPSAYSQYLAGLVR